MASGARFYARRLKGPVGETEQWRPRPFRNGRADSCRADLSATAWAYHAPCGQSGFISNTVVRFQLNQSGSDELKTPLSNIMEIAKC
jgi:hypothetical protein